MPISSVEIPSAVKGVDRKMRWARMLRSMPVAVMLIASVEYLLVNGMTYFSFGGFWLTFGAILVLKW
jgi:hypothetical protein